jgi:CO/xanthine dehydrogenase Mo-binding subunit/Flp pilus assembly pilin Flp
MKFGGKYAPVFASANTATTTQAPSLAAHLARVRVDPETGEVTVLRYIAVHDIGRALNPPAVRGQIQGGVTQGLGWALHEEMIFDEDGQLLTASLMDYALPKTNNIPPSGIETVLVEVPSPEGPFGARPIGEPPVIPVPGAIANAVRAATGVRVTEIPITAARLWAQLHTKSETAVTGVAKDSDEAGGSISTFTSDDGQGLLEYALILVLVAVVVIAILVLLGPEINSIMSRIAPWLSGQ